MVGRFKSKKRIKFKKQILLFFIISICAFIFVFNLLYNKFSLKIDNDRLISYLIDYNLNTENNNILYDIIRLNSTDFLLKYTLGVESENIETTEEVNGLESTYVEDPYNNEVNKPIVYIYNTHQTEGYQKSNNASYNITPSVLMASYILREMLNDYGIPTLVETNNIAEILRANNWQYRYSYRASKLLLEDAINKNPELTYFIDLHRDSVDYNITTTTIDNKKYARILFVIGKNHEGYLNNLKLAENINEELKKFSPSITRGISIKDGTGTGGIYNQDISPNAILIEMGGQYNNITEVNNTLEVLSKAIFTVLKGES